MKIKSTVFFNAVSRKKILGCEPSRLFLLRRKDEGNVWISVVFTITERTSLR